MEPVTLSWQGEEELPRIAKELLEQIGDKPVWLFRGEMGVGKTTLIKELCRQLGAHDALSSPSFAIVNEYAGDSGPIYHIDLYRVETLEEALDLGLLEYVDSGHPCFIEWPQVAEELMPDDAMLLNLVFMPDRSRNLTINPHGRTIQ